MKEEIEKIERRIGILEYNEKVKSIFAIVFAIIILISIGVVLIIWKYKIEKSWLDKWKPKNI